MDSVTSILPLTVDAPCAHLATACMHEQIAVLLVPAVADDQVSVGWVLDLNEPRTVDIGSGHSDDLPCGRLTCGGED